MENRVDSMASVSKCRFSATMKGSVLNGLVESELIEREADGSIDTEKFERFWARSDRNLNAQITDELNEVRKVSEECANYRRSKGHFQCKIAIILSGRLYSTANS